MLLSLLVAVPLVLISSNEIIRLLTDQNITKAHSKHIPTHVCKTAGLKIIYVEQDDELQDIILSIHHASTLTIMNTPDVKIIENQNGQSFISQYSSSVSPNFIRENKTL